MLPQQYMKTWWYIVEHPTFTTEFKWILLWKASYRANTVATAASMLSVDTLRRCDQHF